MKSSIKKSVILVHGAFADGTGWQKVIWKYEEHK
jgi:hypothetical protein